MSLFNQFLLLIFYTGLCDITLSDGGGGGGATIIPRPLPPERENLIQRNLRNKVCAYCKKPDAGAGLAPPSSYGLGITGAGNFRSTAALLVSALYTFL